MYCSIQEAWPEFITEHFNDSQLNYSKNNFQLNQNNLNPTKQNQNIINTMTCENFMEHYNNCDLCKKKILNSIKNNKLIELFTLTPQLKETLIVFLLGILIILLLNLFYK